MSYSINRVLSFLSLPLSVQWPAILVRLPWLVPLQILRITSPEGPYPFIIYLPSRGDYKIPVYVFIPPVDPKTSEIPVHLDFHGGGFVMGSCLEQAPFCALMARETGRIVLSVDYRKGPLDHFPAAIEDAEDVLASVLDSSSQTEAGIYLRQEINHQWNLRYPKTLHPPSLSSTRISLSGFSSGGNLALNLLLSIATDSITWPSLFPASDLAIPTLLFYPSLDSRLLEHERPRPPGVAIPTAFSIALSHLAISYLPMEMRSHPRASPGLADLTGSGLHQRARMLLVLPELDSLASQSELWIGKVRDEGKANQLSIERARGMQHGWTQFPESWLSAEAKKSKKEVFDKAVRFINMYS